MKKGHNIKQLMEEIRVERSVIRKNMLQRIMREQLRLTNRSR